MDKFAYWTLKILSYVFLLSAAASLVLWIMEDNSYSEGMSWVVWIASILTSLFFAATSHVLSRVIERIFATSEEYESSEFDSEE